MKLLLFADLFSSCILIAIYKKTTIFQKANQIFRDRHFSLIDAFIARSDFKKAQSCLKRAVQELGELPELIKRQKLINRNLHPTANRSAPTEEGFSNKKKKIKKLEHLLKNISFNEKIE